jgi:hypothetical protein
VKIDQTIPNAAVPIPGQGLTLDLNGLLPTVTLARTPIDQYFLRYNATTSQAEWALVPQAQITFNAWQDYTPAWQSAGTAPAIGNGTITGKYVQFGKTTLYQIKVSMGSTTTYGTSVYYFTLPTNVLSAGVVWGTVRMNDASASSTYYGFAENDSNTRVAVVTTAQPGVYITNLVPFTWAVSDVVNIFGCYEAA